MPPRMPQESKTLGGRRSSASRSDSPRSTPLTPCNTFSRDLDPRDPSITRCNPDQLESSASDFDHELFNNGEVGALIGQDHEDSFESAGGELAWETCPSYNQNSSPPKSDGHRRSASLSSSSTLNATFARALHATPELEHDSPSKKKAHFDCDVVEPDVRDRRAPSKTPLPRRSSAPATVAPSKAVPGEHASYYTKSAHDCDEEIAKSGSLLQDLMDELFQAEEEDDDDDGATHDLAAFAEEMAEAILDGFEVDYDGDNEDQSPDGSEDSKYNEKNRHDPDMSVDHSWQIRRDEDVEERCLDAEDISVSNEGHARDLDNWSTPQQCLAEAIGSTNARLPTLLSARPIDEEPTIESSDDSTETVLCSSYPEHAVLLVRRVPRADSQSGCTINKQSMRRPASVADFRDQYRKFAPLSPRSKASPAGCAVSTCSVRSASSPRLNTVYQHPETRSKRGNLDKTSTKTAQTVWSNSGSFQLLWEEPPSTSSSCVSLVDNLDFTPDKVNKTGAIQDHTHMQMDKVKTKLAAWSWAREHNLLDEDWYSTNIPLLCFETHDTQLPSNSHIPGDEGPRCPPNTARPSGASSGKQSGASSGKHSAAQSPPGEREIEAADDDEEADEPIEIKVKAALFLHAKDEVEVTPTNYLNVPALQSHNVPASSSVAKHAKAISRQLSNLAADDEHFRGHRDSLVLLRKREQDEEVVNQALTNSQDSVILTRFKFESRYPNRGASNRLLEWGHTRELSPIPDASPPDSRRHSIGSPNVRFKAGNQDYEKSRYRGDLSDDSVDRAFYRAEPIAGSE